MVVQTRLKLNTYGKETMRINYFFKFGIIFCSMLIISQNASALPWDQDLFKQQSLKPGEVARPTVEGTVPRGYTPFLMTQEEADQQLKNPVPMSRNSLLRGKRLWTAQCYACHGADGKSQTVVGPQLAAPNLINDFYSARSDGHSFAYIYLGGANMPRYGYKLSHDEIWDVVNYLRFLQGKNVDGMTRE